MDLSTLIARAREAGLEEDIIQAVEQGRWGAKYHLGLNYMHGRGVERDLIEAVAWFRKAALDQVRNTFSSYYSGPKDPFYRKELMGSPPFLLSENDNDTVKTVALYRKGAEQGLASAQYHLGCCYQYGAGVERNHFGAAAWHRKAAEQGHAEAQVEVGLNYTHGRGVESDRTKAAAWFLKAGACPIRLKEGVEAYLDELYGEEAIAVEYCDYDPVEAVALYRKGAEQGLASAQYHLGCCYKSGRGVGGNLIEAVAWYRKAGEQGHAEAQVEVGGIYARGEGVGKDPVEAVAWYRKAGEQGHAEAQVEVGGIYTRGEGVGKDPVEAVAWYRKAGEQEHAEAQVMLGKCYLNGKGVAPDSVQAVAWFRKAAEQGNADAEHMLGRCYNSGRGVERDRTKAERWFSRARFSKRLASRDEDGWKHDDATIDF